MSRGTFRVVLLDGRETTRFSGRFAGRGRVHGRVANEIASFVGCAGSFSRGTRSNRNSPNRKRPPESLLHFRLYRGTRFFLNGDMGS